MHKDKSIPPSWVLRKVQKSDVPGIMNLYEVAIVPLWKKHKRDYDLKRVEENIVQNLNSPHYFMEILYLGDGDDSDSPAGYFAWENHLDHTSNHIIAHLRMILAHPDNRRIGVGRFLIGEFEKAAKVEGCSKILFDVLVGSSANLFYGSLGYSQWSNFMEKHL
jgi:GNAT superfamily N-acetyltransferase